MPEYRLPWEDEGDDGEYEFPFGTPPEDMNFLSLIGYIEDHEIHKEPPLSVEDIQEIFSIRGRIVVEDNLTYDDRLYVTALMLCWERACEIVKKIIGGEYTNGELSYRWNLLMNLMIVGQEALAESLDRQTGYFMATHVIAKPSFTFSIVEGNTGLGRIFLTYDRWVKRSFWGECVN